ncbi:Isopentenyl transferase-like protein [Elsinoe fawcettii]|nr:Isopentenyl transferase-like protein [Elsinoe fawcettii]
MSPFSMDEALTARFTKQCELGSPSDPQTTPIIFILGPRGTGKTQLAFSIAEQVSGELVVIDSLKVYRDGSALTGRPVSRGNHIRHHMSGFLSPTDEPTTLTDDLLSTVHRIHRGGKVAILYGGSTTLTTPLLFCHQVQALNPLVIILHGKNSDLESHLATRIDHTTPSILTDIRKLYTLERLMFTSEARIGLFKAHGYEQMRTWAKAAASSEAQMTTGATKTKSRFSAPLARNTRKTSHRKLKTLMETGLQQLKASVVDYARRQSQWLFQEVIPTLQSQDMDFRIFHVPGPGRGLHTFETAVVLPVLAHVQDWLARRRQETTVSEQIAPTDYFSPSPTIDGQSFWKEGEFDWSMVTPIDDQSDQQQEGTIQTAGRQHQSCAVEASMDLRDVRRHFASYGL